MSRLFMELAALRLIPVIYAPDGAQSLTYDSFHETMNNLRAVAQAVGREI